jgi:hypothetical protein
MAIMTKTGWETPKYNNNNEMMKGVRKRDGEVDGAEANRRRGADFAEGIRHQLGHGCRNGAQQRQRVRCVLPVAHPVDLAW